MTYGLVLPQATYCPWAKDAEFQRIYSAIRNHTLVDEYRCYELWNLVKQSAKLARGALIEVGVWRGGTGAVIAAMATSCAVGPVYLCDTFKGVVKAGPQDSMYRGGEHGDTTPGIVEELFGGLSLRAELLHGVFPEESGHLVADQQFRFAHIDVDVYQSAKDAAEWLWPRMVRGGIMVFDDYGFYGCEGVTKFVEEFAEEFMSTPDRIFIHNLNGHAVVIKL